MTRIAGLIGRTVSLLLVALFLLIGATTTAFAQEDAPPDDGSDRLVAEGRLVYEANCAACHRSDGTGRSGAFPPLLDNPSVDNSDYVRTVVLNGLSGEVEALGETYNGNMPAFAQLADEQVTSLTVYLQEGLGQPLPPAPPSTDSGGTAGTSLPSGAVITYGIGFLIALIGAGVVLTPIVLAKSEGGTFTPVQTWLKSGAIVAYFVIATVVIPSMVVESDALASSPSVWGDLISDDLWDIIRSLIGTGVWMLALGIGVWGLRRVQRNKVI